jgi:hypothetical protein
VGQKFNEEKEINHFLRPRIFLFTNKIRGLFFVVRGPFMIASELDVQMSGLQMSGLFIRTFD